MTTAWLREIDVRLQSLARRLSSGRGLPLAAQTALVGAPAFAMVLALGLFILPRFVREDASVRDHSFAEKIDEKQWLVSYDAVSDFKELASKREYRDQKRTHSVELNRRQGRWYWLGLEISPERLRRLASARATWLFAGNFYGSLQVFIDDRLSRTGTRADVRDPLILDLTPLLTRERLAGKEPLRIAIRIRHEMGEPFPDMLNESGFATQAQIEIYRRWALMHDSILVSISFGAALALGLFYLALWLSSARKQEMAAFAAFGLLHAAIQAGYISFVWIQMGALEWHRLNFVTSVYEVVMTVWLGLSLARLRSRWVLLAVAGFLLAPWAIFLTSMTAGDIYQVVLLIWNYGTTSGYLAAALLCLSQARLVSAERSLESIDLQRVVKLHASWIILLLMAAAQYEAARMWIDIRVVNVALLAGLAAIVVHDYRQQDLFVRRAPLSKYHQRAELPERVQCVLATVDLKRSESLYRYGAMSGVGGACVVEIVSKFYRHVTDAGGEVLQTEGDSLMFFFDCETTAGAVDRAVTAVRALDRILRKHLEEQSRLARPISGVPFPADLRLRAALDRGAIRPTRQRFEGRDVAGWEQAGGSQVFVDVARLMEAESKTVPTDRSSIALKPELAPEVRGAAPEAGEVEIKHGRMLKFAIVSLDAAAAP